VTIRARRWLCLAALTLVAVGASACGVAASASPTAIAKADVPFNLLRPAPPTTVPAVAPTTVSVPETMYMVGPKQRVVAVSRYVPIPASLSEILDGLLEGPTDAESRFGLQSFLTGDKTAKATVTGGIATVDFTTNPVQVVGTDQTLAIAQVVYTATQQPGVTGVVFQIAGQPIEVPTASGVQVPGPVNRSAYAPQAPAG
jgi:hypothetical protein